MIFLPIKPEFAFAISSKKKKVEFRKVKFKKQDIKYCLVYASSPYKKVIGYFEIEKVDEESPSKAWKKYQAVGQISKKKFEEYYKDSEVAYVIKIKKFFELKQHVDPKEKIKDFEIPQSFKYLSEQELESLLPEESLHLVA